MTTSTPQVHEQEVSCLIGKPLDVVSHWWQQFFLLCKGVDSKDTSNMATMRITECITEIASEETKSREELRGLVARAKAPNLNKSELKTIVTRGRALKETLNLICRKRQVMDQHLDTLRQSKINQSMLQSMKHTNEALQTLGLKVTDADSIMLDLEDNINDASSLQHSLGAPYDTVLASEDDLEEELARMLSDDSFSTVSLVHNATTKQLAPEVAQPLQSPEQSTEQSTEQVAEESPKLSLAVEHTGQQALPHAEQQHASALPLMPAKQLARTQAIERDAAQQGTSTASTSAEKAEPQEPQEAVLPTADTDVSSACMSK